jgi:hypothetical protein
MPVLCFDKSPTLADIFGLAFNRVRGPILGQFCFEESFNSNVFSHIPGGHGIFIFLSTKIGGLSGV